MSQIITVGITEKLVIVAGMNMTPLDAMEFDRVMTAKFPDKTDRPQFIWLPGPAEIKDIRKIPPNVAAAAEFVREWIESQP